MENSLLTLVILNLCDLLSADYERIYFKNVGEQTTLDPIIYPCIDIFQNIYFVFYDFKKK